MTVPSRLAGQIADAMKHAEFHSIPRLRPHAKPAPHDFIARLLPQSKLRRGCLPGNDVGGRLYLFRLRAIGDLNPSTLANSLDVSISGSKDVPQLGGAQPPQVDFVPGFQTPIRDPAPLKGQLPLVKSNRLLWFRPGLSLDAVSFVK